MLAEYKLYGSILKSRAFFLRVFLLAISLAGPIAAQTPAGKTDSADTAALTRDESTLVLGENGSQGTARQSGQADSASLLRLLVVLGVLAGGVWLAIVLVRKASPRQADEDNPIRIAATASLGPGRSVHAVCLGSRAWLLAVSESSITLIDSVEDPETLRDLLRRAETAPSLPAQTSGLAGTGKRRGAVGDGRANLGVMLPRALAESFGRLFPSPGSGGTGTKMTKVTKDAAKRHPGGNAVEPGDNSGGSTRAGVSDVPRGFLSSQRERLGRFRDGGKA